MKNRIDFPPSGRPPRDDDDEGGRKDTKGRARREARELKRSAGADAFVPAMPVVAEAPAAAPSVENAVGAPEVGVEVPDTALGRALASAEAARASGTPPKKGRAARSGSAKGERGSGELRDIERDVMRAYDQIERRIKFLRKDPTDLAREQRAAIKQSHSLRTLVSKYRSESAPEKREALRQQIDDEYAAFKTFADKLTGKDGLVENDAHESLPPSQNAAEAAEEPSETHQQLVELFKGLHKEVDADLAAEAASAVAPVADPEPAPELAGTGEGAPPEPEKQPAKEAWNLGESLSQAKREAQEAREAEKQALFMQIQDAKREEAAYDAKGDALDTDEKAKRDRLRDARWALQSKLDRAIDEDAGTMSQDPLEKEFWHLDASTPWDVRAKLEARMAERLQELKSGLTTDLPTKEAYEANRKREVEINGLTMVHDSLVRGQAEGAKIEAKEKASVKRPTTADGTEIPESIGAIRPEADITESKEGYEPAVWQYAVRGEEGTESAAAEHVPDKDSTPQEHRSFWKRLFAEKIKPETGEKPKSRAEQLAARSKELDAEAEKVKGGWVTKAIEKYNGLSLMTKLGVTGSLMIGAWLTPVAMPLLSTAFVTALTGQRAVGSAGFMLNRRAALDAAIKANPQHRLKNLGAAPRTLLAAGQALIYFALTSWATDKVLGALMDTETGQAIAERTREVMGQGRDYLAHMLGHDRVDLASPTVMPEQLGGPEELSGTPAPEVPAAPVAAEVAAVEPSASAAETLAAVPTPTDESVQALINAHAAAESRMPITGQIPEASPAATDLPMGEYEPRPTYPTYDIDAGAATQEQAPVVDASPALPPLSDDTIVLDGQGNPVMTAEGPLRTGDYVPQPEVTASAAPEPQPTEAPSLMTEPLAPQPSIDTTPLPAQPDIESVPLPQPSEAPVPDIDAFEPSPDVPQAEAPATSDAIDTVAAPAPEVAPLFTTLSHEPIDVSQPAIYEAQLPNGETFLAAYGGTDEERLSYIQDFLAKPDNAEKVIRWAHELDGSIVVDDFGAPKQESGGFLSYVIRTFSNTQPPAPAPEMLLRRVDK